MSYRALYRVWRPQRFDELIGQQVITQTLKNAITTGQISHAYLFAGPRGTGKTSAAKIFAKAVNCPNQKDGEPCNHCPICKAITAGKLNDVIEIDAASNNGVDEIRNVRDKAKYAPTQAKYKVYIIDEVHMLSTGAFNALLKTLEEPPAHVIFIMATTEPQKIPATIISRTQRFNFQRIQPADILSRMQYILKHEKVTYDDKALKVIARSAEGGMRDALGILDEVMSYGKDHVSYHNALEVTGSVTKDLLYRYLKEVADHDVKDALADVQQILDSGKDANQFVEELINYCQDILLYQQSPQMVLKKELGIVDDNFKNLAKKINPDLIYKIIGRVDSVEERMRFTVHPDVYLEVLTVRIATIHNQSSQSSQVNSKTDEAITDLAHQVNDLKTKVEWLQSHRTAPASSNSAQASHQQSSSQTTSESPSSRSVNVDLAKVYPILNKATRPDLNRMKSAWNQIVRKLPVTERAMMSVSKPVAASKKGIVVAFAYSFFYERASENQNLINTLSSDLDQIVGNLPSVVFVPDDQWPKIRRDYYMKHRPQVVKNRTPSVRSADSVAITPKSQPSSVVSVSHSNSQLMSSSAQVSSVAPQSSESPKKKRARLSKQKAVKIFGKDINKILKIKDD